MTVECITCDRLSLRDHPTQAKQGLGRCSLRKRAGVFVSIAFARDCAKHTPAAGKQVSARRDWVAKRGRK